MFHRTLKKSFKRNNPLVHDFYLRITLVLAVFYVGPVHALPPEGKIILRADTFAGLSAVTSQGWEQSSQRDELRPAFFVAEGPSLGGPGALGIYGASNGLIRGCWRKLAGGIEAGSHYRFEASYLARGIDYPRLKVFARLNWSNPTDNRPGSRDYVPELDSNDGWQKVGGTFRAPEGAQEVSIELFLSHSSQGTVWWDGITLAQVPDPPRRVVRVGTANCRPSENTSSAESVEEFCQVVEEAGRKGCDIVCLGEGINLIGVSSGGKAAKYPDIAEPIPGPTTRRLGELASKHKMYIIAALGERENHAVYNTAVLIDRRGEIIGKYRKVYLPEGELDQGCSPGNSYPVFDTDFGRIGIMICWDSSFPEPARALSAGGAEIIFLPIWGGNSTLIRARAIENHVYVVSSGYDIPTNIYDIWGTLLGEATAEERPGVVTADIDLNYPPVCPYSWPLGNIRHIFMHELRNDIRVPALEH